MTIENAQISQKFHVSAAIRHIWNHQINIKACNIGRHPSKIATLVCILLGIIVFGLPAENCVSAKGTHLLIFCTSQLTSPELFSPSLDTEGHDGFEHDSPNLRVILGSDFLAYPTLQFFYRYTENLMSTQRHSFAYAYTDVSVFEVVQQIQYLHLVESRQYLLQKSLCLYRVPWPNLLWLVPSFHWTNLTITTSPDSLALLLTSSAVNNAKTSFRKQTTSSL